MYEAKILKHSISEAGFELVTFEVNYPHAVHKDVMTHRWSRNFQSFRAVPPEKLLEKLEDGGYFIPEVFGHRVKGMGQRNEPVTGQESIDQKFAREIWIDHVGDTIGRARQYLLLGMAKQQVNFLLQDLCFIRGIITTTMPQLLNFFALRLEVDENGDPIARPEVHKVASLMREAYNGSEPVEHLNKWLDPWHLPLVTDEEYSLDGSVGTSDYWKKVSVGRCARVSYLTHDGIRDPDADINLHDMLQSNGHMSPFEHQGQAIIEPWFDALDCGSFGFGWTQYRKFIPHEAVYQGKQHVPVD